MTEPDEEQTFAVLRLTGERFDPPGMPVPALSEVVAYEEVVTEVAKALFFQLNPHRSRVPRGFVERFGLRLERVADGSATPVLTRPTPLQESVLRDLFDDPWADEFSRARDLVNEMIASAAAGGGLPAEFPEIPAAVLRRLGQTLRLGEGLQISAQQEPNWAGVPAYTPAARRNLLIRQTGTYTGMASVSGLLVNASFEAGTFAVRTAEGRIVTAPYDAETFKIVHRAAEPTPTRPLLIEGIAVYGQDNYPQRFESVASVAPAADDPLEQRYERVRADMDEHARLGTGWLGDGEGEQISRDAYSLARVIVDTLERLGMTAPYVYPTPEGGLQFEWTAGTDEISVEVAQDGTIAGHVTEVRTGDFDEVEFPQSRAPVSAVVEWVRTRLDSAS